MKKFIVCITGASGAIYGIKIVKEISKNHKVYLIVSNHGYEVLKWEENIEKEQFLKMFNKNVEFVPVEDIASHIASGSTFKNIEGVIIAPCSTGTLSAIANGMSLNLIHRVADVALKERKKLYLLLREMPFSLVHIENMRKITYAGGIVASASPGFYHQPKTMEDLINFVVGKVLDFFNIDHNLFKRWRENYES